MSEPQPVTAICPGSYDPVTNGHLDIIHRAAKVFDHIIVGVIVEPHHKQTTFTVEERIAFLQEALAGVENVTVEAFSDLVVDFANCFPDARHTARDRDTAGLSSWTANQFGSIF